MQSIQPETLLSLQTDPPRLEAAYRERPDAFAEALSVALDRQPDSVALRVWAARLDLELATDDEPPPPPGWEWAGALPADRLRALAVAVVACVAVAGTWAKGPEIARALGWAPETYYYATSEPFWLRSFPFFVVGPLVVLFALRYRPDRRVLAVVGGAVAALLVVQMVRPIHTDAGELSVMHAPLVLLSLAGAAALGRRWRETDARIGYLQLVSETVAFAALLMIGGVVLVLLTGSLFGAVGVEAWRFLTEWVAAYGALGVLPVAALIVSQRVGTGRVAPLVARVFGPMALAVLAVYLPVLVAQGGLADRDSLFALNVALVAVLALVILMQAERPDVRRHWTDGVAFGLVALALVADLAAFGSIVGRLADGLTPNRLAVVGMNALVATHLAGLVLPMGRRALGRGQWPGDGWTARFLTVYAAWSAVVVLAFPLLFWGV